MMLSRSLISISSLIFILSLSFFLAFPNAFATVEQKLEERLQDDPSPPISRGLEHLPVSGSQNVFSDDGSPAVPESPAPTDRPERILEDPFVREARRLAEEARKDAERYRKAAEQKRKDADSWWEWLIGLSDDHKARAEELEKLAEESATSARHHEDLAKRWSDPNYGR